MGSKHTLPVKPHHTPRRHALLLVKSDLAAQSALLPWERELLLPLIFEALEGLAELDAEGCEASHDRRAPTGLALHSCSLPNDQATVRSRRKDGRLVLDEPTDLTEGAEVELAIFVDDEDELLQELEASAVEEAAGGLVDFDAVIARL
jgi:hypothetical protein